MVSIMDLYFMDTQARFETRAGADAMIDHWYKRKNRGQKGEEDQTDCSPRIMSRRVSSKSASMPFSRSRAAQVSMEMVRSWISA